MTYKICYWDAEEGIQKERDSTSAEDTQRDLDIEAAAIVQVPVSVTMRQARLALLGAGLLASVDTTIDNLPSPTKEQARIEWDYSSEVQRHRGLVSTVGAALGLTEAQLDSLFITAAAL